MSNVDISGEVASCKTWSTEEALNWATELQREKKLRLDWDDDAGESWIVLLDLNDVVAIIHTDLQLAFIKEPTMRLQQEIGEQVICIPFDHYEESACFQMKPELISRFEDPPTRFEKLPSAWVSAQVDPSSFSVADLYFMTV